eukprot:3243573-Amphidinium_carterae.1
MKRNIRNLTRSVQGYDVAQWIRQHYTPEDYIYVKMDIEGAEYAVIKRMLDDGVAEWVSKWAVEWHSLAAHDLEMSGGADVRIALEQVASAVGAEYSPYF